MNRAYLLIFLLVFSLMAAISLDTYLQITKDRSLFTYIPYVKDLTAFKTTEEVLSEADRIDHKAGFSIITGGYPRNFNLDIYFNRSPYVFLEQGNAGIIHVKKKNTTWGEFFKSLPSLTITKTCIDPGTGQSYCTGPINELHFLLNGVETPNVMSLSIQDGDRVLIIYGSEDPVKRQILSEGVPNPY